MIGRVDINCSNPPLHVTHLLPTVVTLPALRVQSSAVDALADPILATSTVRFLPAI
jgi:hypothetical protein